jgi:glycosyltransferase involved in cell wall biosynthesis
MTADTVGGVFVYALELARALASHRIRTTLATMGRLLSRDQRRAAAAVPGLELRESAFRLEWMQEPWRDLERAGDWLLELEVRERPDVVHLNGYVHGALAWRSPVLVVGHSCVLSWWRAVKGEEAPREWARYRDAVREGLQSAELVVAPTRSMLRALDEHYGPLGAVRVVPNGRQASFVAPGRKEPFVLCAGRLWDEAKNLPVLDRAAGAIPWPVYAAGETREPAARRRGETRRLRRLGRLSPADLAHWLSRAAIFAHPARYEPFGLSVLEAALAGCALVLGDIESLRENWDGAALFVDPEDEGLLAEAIRGLCLDAERCRSLGGLARDRARAFGPGQMSKGYLAAYGWLLSRGWEERACAS